MDSKQIRFVIGVFGLVLLSWLLSPLLATRKPPLPRSQAPLSFNATNAHKVAQEFVTRFPRRVFGSLESRQSTGYLGDYLTKLGYSVEYSHFDARIAGPKKVGRNVLALKNGDSPEILALVAHFDTARTTEQGAMKNGAAVGVLLEMARIFATTPTRRSLLFVFSDGEEWGMLGAKDLAENHADRDSIVAVLSLDGVSLGDLDGFCLEETGQLAGFSPPWLRQLAQHAAESQGLPITASSGLREHLERAVLISWADQGPFLKAGIPAINLGSTSLDRALEKAVYHSPQDTIENIKTASIETYGRAAESIVRTLDSVESIPTEFPESFRLRGTLFLDSNVVLVLHTLAFLPIPVIFFFQVKNHRGQLSRMRIVRELLAYTGTILPFLAIYFFIFLMRGLRLLPIYDLYPATPKDPVLETPSWGWLCAIFGTAVAIAAISYIIQKYSFRDFPKPNYRASKLILLSFMLIIVAAAMLYNSYWASAFLLLPAWIWALIDSGQSLGKRTRNSIWILAAGTPYYAALWMYGGKLDMCWNFIWYQVLALSTGLFTGAGYYLAVAAIALGIRFVCIQFHETTVQDNIPRASGASART